MARATLGRPRKEEVTVGLHDFPGMNRSSGRVWTMDLLKKWKKLFQRLCEGAIVIEQEAERKQLGYRIQIKTEISVSHYLSYKSNEQNTSKWKSKQEWLLSLLENSWEPTDLLWPIKGVVACENRSRSLCYVGMKWDITKTPHFQSFAFPPAKPPVPAHRKAL